MNKNKLYCELCNKEFNIDCSVTEIAEHLANKHKVDGLIGLIGAAILKNPVVEVRTNIQQDKEAH